MIVGCAGTGPGEQIAPGAKLVVIHAENRFFECPVWDRRHGQLYFDSYDNKIDWLVRYDGAGKVTPQPGAEGIGGAFLGRDGRLLAADCNKHRILSFATGPDGLSDPKVLAADPSWHQPNDLCQLANGDIYFTDPDFKGKKDGGVYHLAASGKVTKMVSHLPCPNGVTAANDGRTLYVSDSQLKEWWSFPVLADGRLGQGRVFFKPEAKSQNAPDGLTIDEYGNLYFTGLGGVWIVSPAGQKLDFIPVPEFCSNVRFGGPTGPPSIRAGGWWAGRTLYITCSKKVYSLAMRVRGGGW